MVWLQSSSVDFVAVCSNFFFFCMTCAVGLIGQHMLEVSRLETELITHCGLSSWCVHWLPRTTHSSRQPSARRWWTRLVCWRSYVTYWWPVVCQQTSWQRLSTQCLRLYVVIQPTRTTLLLSWHHPTHLGETPVITDCKMHSEIHFKINLSWIITSMIQGCDFLLFAFVGSPIFYIERHPCDLCKSAQKFLKNYIYYEAGEEETNLALGSAQLSWFSWFPQSHPWASFSLVLRSTVPELFGVVGFISW